MSRLIAIIACTRPDQVGRMVESLADCDEVRIAFDPTRQGQAITRNSLLSGIEASDVVRVCDDDDEALNSRLLWQEFSTDAEALLFSYEINGRTVRVPEDSRLAAIDHVISCNWMVRGSLIRRLGELFDPTRQVNTGTWAWLRVLDAARGIQVEPSIVGYRYHQRADGAHAGGWSDAELFARLSDLARGNPAAERCLAARLARR
jgi:hypothetical protein